MKKRNRWMIPGLVILAGLLFFAAYIYMGKPWLSTGGSPVLESQNGDSGADGDSKADGERQIVISESGIAGQGSRQSSDGAVPIKQEDGVELPGYQVNLKYENYPMSYTYVVALGEGVNVRKAPGVDSQVLCTVPQFEKLDYIETITMDGGGAENTWHHICFIEEESGMKKFGFVRSDVAVKRVFQFARMEEKIRTAEAEINKGYMTYVNNYKNGRGVAPLYYGKTEDDRGGHRSQSAPGYIEPENEYDFIYIGDGTLVRRLEDLGEKSRVEVLGGGQYYVPNEYLAASESISTLTRVIAIDRTNQNEGVYEKIDGQWTLISYALATTGKEGEYSMPTPLGYYFVIEKKDHFLYYKDGTEEIQGFAPYVLRFAGGAYIHGVPVNYQYNEDGTRVKPPLQEHSRTMGTIPLSHKCVRNYTSHAKFLWDWYVQGETIVIVIE